MKRHLIYIFTYLQILNFLTGCAPTPKPVPEEDVYDYGFITRYGAYYQDQGIESNVFMLDVYTPGLRLNDQDKIEGTGLNLCFSDVFTLPTDTKLQDDVTYEADSTGRANSFLPGQDFEGNINGAYLLDIRDNQVHSITLFREGTFTMTHSGDTAHIVFELITDKKAVYKATYHAPLPYKRKL